MCLVKLFGPVLLLPAFLNMKKSQMKTLASFTFFPQIAPISKGLSSSLS